MPVDRHVKVELVLEGVPPHPLVRILPGMNCCLRTWGSGPEDS